MKIPYNEIVDHFEANLEQVINEPMPNIPKEAAILSGMMMMITGINFEASKDELRIQKKAMIEAIMRIAAKRNWMMMVKIDEPGPDPNLN